MNLHIVGSSCVQKLRMVTFLYPCQIKMKKNAHLDVVQALDEHLIQSLRLLTPDLYQRGLHLGQSTRGHSGGLLLQLAVELDHVNSPFMGLPLIVPERANHGRRVRTTQAGVLRRGRARLPWVFWRGEPRAARPQPGARRWPRRTVEV